MVNTIIHGDCLEIMPSIPDKSVGMILCDLPYGTTQNKWDTVIPFELLWPQYERIIKEDGVIALTAAQPFTSQLICSNPKMFKHVMVWDKRLGTGHLNAKKMPLRRHEDICIFSKAPNGRYTYNPQMRKGKFRTKSTGKGSENYGSYQSVEKKNDIYYPTSIIELYAPQAGKVHPTQKPVELFEYLIKTFSNPGDLILDNCIGSGTTAIAALKSGRDFIGIEKEIGYVEIAKQRVDEFLLQGAI